MFPQKNLSKYWYFSGNTWKCVSMATNHHGHNFISSYSKYQSFRFICHPNKNSLVFPSHSLYIEMDWTSMAIFSRVLRDSTPRFVGQLVRPSIGTTLLLWGFCGLWPHCSCPSDQVTSSTAPAHLHVTGVVVYPKTDLLRYHVIIYRMSLKP